MQTFTAESPGATAPTDAAPQDLGPLAWVQDELRKSLEAAIKSLRRFVRDANLTRASQDPGALDSTQLRIARQQLHQAVGALDMVGQSPAALMVRAMEAVVQKFVQQPALCNEPAVAGVEQAGFALVEYLDAVLAGKATSAVALFPQYRAIQELAGADRVHPADLFSHGWHWADAGAALPQAAPLAYAASARAELDQAVLRTVRSSDPEAALQLRDMALGFAAAQGALQPRVFWQLAAGCAEAIALGLLPVDIYVKRAATRMLLQYSTLAQGDTSVSERLAQDLLFFCAQTDPDALAHAGVLTALRNAHQVGAGAPVNYNETRFGRFDPALLSQARKRIAAAKEAWSHLSGGDAQKLKPVADQFSLVADSLVKLHPPSAALAQTLTEVMENTLRSGAAPSTEVAMEVATSVLYLEAVLQDLALNDPQLVDRTTRLSQRLTQVLAGNPAQPLEAWMEELYRRVSDRQTMGSVVGELRTAMLELEGALDQFFRQPREKGVLTQVPAQLGQMRGVLSVLGLEQAAFAVLRMRETVEDMLVTEVDPERAGATFDTLGNNLGALGFLIDMLNYQPALAKKLFVFDNDSGELRPLMGRSQNASPQPPTVAAPPEPADTLAREALAAAANPDAPALTERLGALATSASLAEQPALAAAAAAAARAASSQESAATEAALSQLATVAAAPEAQPEVPAETPVEEDDLRGIFLDEAREVVATGRQAIAGLQDQPGNEEHLTTLRRTFHTLKGSSRMVGLGEFGTAAWSVEQVLNTWLADQLAATPALLTLCGQALDAFAGWVEDIAQGKTSIWQAEDFRASADALRLEGRLLPLSLASSPSSSPTDEQPQDLAPLEPLVVSPVEAVPAAEAAPTAQAFENFDEVDFDLDDGAAEPAPADLPAPAAEPLALSEPDFAALFGDIDLNLPGNTDAPAPPLEIQDIDLPSLAAVADAPVDLTEAATEVAAELPPWTTPELMVVAETPVPESEPALAEMPAEPFAEAAAGSDSFDDNPLDEQVKVIDGLRINIALYNVYLNEADEWSRQLLTSLGEWALELHQPLPAEAQAMAHALAGSSATVGFQALSGLAKTLEMALQHAAAQTTGMPEQAQVFVAAAEEIRRLLHQFAAGFLKEPNPAVVQALDDLQTPVVPAPVATPEAPPEFAPEPPPEVPEFIQNQPSAGVPVEFTATEFAVTRFPAERLATDADDELDQTDAVDVDLFPIFEEEAVELLPQLGAALRQWTARPDNGSARTEVLRVLHTLKGSARLAGALRLGEMAHLFESEIESLGADQQDSTLLSPLLGRFDALQATFDQLRASDAQRYQALNTPVAEPETTLYEPVQPSAPWVPLGPVAALDVVTPAGAAAASRQAASQTVRVRSQLLERLLNQAGEIMLTRTRMEGELGQLRGALKEMTGNLDRLRAQLRDIELQAETQMESRLAQAKESQLGFDPLEFDRFTRVQELTRMMAESVNDVGTVQRNLQRTVEVSEDELAAQARQTRELQRDLLRTRMLEFEGISERLYRVVRQTSKETGKQVGLDIVGGSIEMDRAVLDRMTPAFEHLLRNSVVHGIESPENRLANGKTANGLITVRLRQEGNDVSVEFQDDGAGLDLYAIRNRALALGLVRGDEFLDDASAAALIQVPGFSTASEVTELAGRGIGMDVVRSEVVALGGRIETHSQSGQGTRFKLVLPLTTAVTQVVMLRMGALAIGVPASVLELVRRTNTADLAQAYASGSVAFGGETVPFFWGGALLQNSQRSSEGTGKNTPVVIIRSAGQRVALHVDEVLGNQEVVVKNLGAQLARLPGLSGMTVLASGAVALIYNPVALATVYGAQARDWMARGGSTEMASTPAAATQVPLVLVVDDSITVRRVTQRLLQREGYRVALAADGLQALKALSDERPALVLSDIEMPRMDGFDLLRAIRNDAALAGLPVVMITSRMAQKHRDHARDLGADHYLGKPYAEDELLGLVQQYANAEKSIQ
ncbi:MAG: Hpt domain-containing protein [Pseudomonadota bacterium]